MICQISSSVIPTPWPLVPLAGIAVPGIPLLMFWNKSASELPWRFCERVRSGPRPPPRAPSPWQKAQFRRNWNSPSLAIFASPAYGFFSCAKSGSLTLRQASKNKQARLEKRSAIPLFPGGVHGFPWDINSQLLRRNRSDAGNYTTGVAQEKLRTSLILQLLERRGKVPADGAESRVALSIKFQAGAVQKFPVQDHGFDFARIANPLRRIPRNNNNVCRSSGLQAPPFFLRIHDARRIECRQTNRLQRRQSRRNQQFHLTVKSLSLKHARVGSVGPCRNKHACVQQFLDVALHLIETCSRLLHFAFLRFAQVPRCLRAQVRQEPRRSGVGNERLFQKFQIGEPAPAGILFHRQRSDDKEPVLLNGLNVVGRHFARGSMRKAIDPGLH